MIDEKLKELGFIKQEESKHGAFYTKEIKEDGYTHCLDILHKANGNHIIQSYQKGLNSDDFSNMVGLTYKETKLALKNIDS